MQFFDVFTTLVTFHDGRPFDTNLAVITWAESLSSLYVDNLITNKSKLLESWERKESQSK